MLWRLRWMSNKRGYRGLITLSKDKNDRKRELPVVCDQPDN
jgi:hypothetical protein